MTTRRLCVSRTMWLTTIAMTVAVFAIVMVLR